MTGMTRWLGLAPGTWLGILAAIGIFAAMWSSDHRRSQ